MAAYESLKAKKEQLSLAKEALENAKESLRLNAGRHKLGIALPLEVIQAEDACLTSQNDYIEAVTDYNKSQYRLRAAIGL